MKSTAKVIYHDKSLLSKVRKSADEKFGNKNSYTKNLWTLRSYKKQGGRVSYQGEKQSNKKIEQSVAFAVAMKDWLSAKADKWPELFETEDVDIESAAKEDCEDMVMKKIYAYFQENISEFDSIEDFLDEVDDMEEDDMEEDDTLEEQCDASDLSKSQEKIDEVYAKYHKTVNMGYSALKKWAENPCSYAASLSRAPISRNLRLLSKAKDKWTMADVRSANRTISFVSRMKGAQQGQPVKDSNGKSCPSKRDISLKNWAYSP
jgi:hypothetical protein